MRPEQEAIYRKVNPADIGRLEGKRNQVARDVYSWLCVGTDSTMSGLRRASPAQLAESLGWSIPSVKSALQTLHELRMIVWSPEVSVAYTFTAQREPPQNERHCKGLKRDTSWCPPCSAKSQALDDIGDRRDTVSHTVKDTVKDTSTQDSGLRIQVSDSSTQNLPVAAAPAPVKPTPTDTKVDELIEAYNAARQGRMPECKGTDLQRKAIAAALKREPLPIWIARVQRGCKSPLLKGDKGDWRADLGWMLKPSSADKIDAGNYDDNGGSLFSKTPKTFRGDADMTEAQKKELIDSLTF